MVTLYTTISVFEKKYTIAFGNLLLLQYSSCYDNIYFSELSHSFKTNTICVVVY